MSTIVPTVLYDQAEETPEAKALWFQSLTLTERMDLLCWFTDMILSVNPGILEQKDAEPVTGRVLVLSREDLIASKLAAGRPQDLEDARLLGLSDHE